MKISGSLLALGAASLTTAMLGTETGLMKKNRLSALADHKVITSRSDPMKYYTFDQLIDHSNPKRGTFKQRYWVNTDFWKGPGSPIIVYNEGEDSGMYSSALDIDNITLPGQFAQTNGGAAILIEQRYFGESSPFKSLTAETLQYLTLENSVADMTNFAKNVELPFDKEGKSKPDKAPWILTGTSFGGSVAAWTQALSPGTYWAYTASSAMVQARDDYWQYFQSPLLGMRKNCTYSIDQVISFMDKVLETGPKEDIYDLQGVFGLEHIARGDDFMNALTIGPEQWLYKDFDHNYKNGSFESFCDYIENSEPGSKTGPVGEAGVGLWKALEGYAKWYKDTVLSVYCDSSYPYWPDEGGLACYNLHNKSSRIFTDTSVESLGGQRQWQWILCNEPFGWWKTGPPQGQTALISRLINNNYWESQCGRYFPTVNGHTYGRALGKKPSDVNKRTGGWNPSKPKRIIFTDGEWDIWRGAGVNALDRPGGPMKSTEDAPVFLIPGGLHRSDYWVVNGKVDDGVKNIIDQEIAIVKRWVGEFYKEKGLKQP